MSPEELDPGLREWLCAREMLRKLGFSPDELFFACQPAGLVVENGVHADLGKPVVMLLLQAQGKKFSWIIDTVDVPADKVEQAFQDACDLWNSPGGDDWRDEMFVGSHAFAMRLQLVQVLKEKGFSFTREIFN